MENKIAASWQQNSRAWIETIEQEHIASRKLATNQAILRAILREKPTEVLDMGCGEGWLCRQLQASGIATLGIDVAEELITHAKNTSKGTFLCYGYEALIEGSFEPEQHFDVIAFNYSLFGEASTPAILKKAGEWLKPQGKVIIQTLDPAHPAFAGFKSSQWIQEDWGDMKASFVLPMDWYYRIHKDWLEMFANLGYEVAQQENIRHPLLGSPISVIFTLRKSD